MFNTADRMEALPFSGIRVMMERANKMQKEGCDVIHMEIGRPDFDTPEVIKKAAYDSLEKGRVFYTSNYGTPELRAAIAEKLTKENGVEYKPEEILVTIGVGEGTYASMAAFHNPGDEVLVPNPVWLNYIHVPNFFGVTPVTYTLKEENDFQIDIDEIISKITDKTKMMVINTPGNPTGTVQSRETLEKLAEIAKKYDLLVVADEIYEKLTYGGVKHVSIASLPGMKERTITLNGFSKCYSMTGWRCGFAACGDKRIAKVMTNCLSHALGSIGAMNQAAMAEAMRGPQESVDEMRKVFEERRNYLVERMNRIDGVSCLKPDGAFYVMMNLEKLIGRTLGGRVIRNADDFAMAFLEKGLVAVVSCCAFDAPNFVRWTYATSLETIKEGLDRLEKFLKEG